MKDEQPKRLHMTRYGPRGWLWVVEGETRYRTDENGQGLWIERDGQFVQRFKPEQYAVPYPRVQAYNFLYQQYCRFKGR